MYALTPAAIDWLAAHHGVASRADLARLGVREHQIDRLVRVGFLAVYTRGIYRLAAAPRSTEQAAALACAVAPHVVVSHTSAGRMWGLRGLGGDQRLHVTIWGWSNVVVPGAVVHRSHKMDLVDIVERSDGIRVTSPPRTAFDLAWHLSDQRLGSIFEQLLHEKRCTLPTLFATGRRLCGGGRKGSSRYTRVLQSRPSWLKPVGSDLELRFERAILAAGLPRPLRQAAIMLPTGEEVHPDFYWPDAARVVEVDHITWHGGKLDLTYDKKRDRLLERGLGINTTRITDSEIRCDLVGFIDDLRVLLTSSRASKVSQRV